MTEATEEKKTVKKAAATPSASARASMMAKVRAAILKQTGHKPLKPGSSAYVPVSTGSFPVDMLIGGTPTLDGKGLVCPGFPRRRITELYGAESSGKTTLLIASMVQAQKAGGSAIFIDFEHSLDHHYAKRLGLSYDEDKLTVIQPDTMEEGFTMMRLGILGGVDIIGVDSVAAMVPEDELVKKADESAKIGAVAAKFSRELPKFAIWLQKYPLISEGKSDPNHAGTALVLINQTRALINTGGGGYGGGGGEDNTSGGKALKFYAYLRLRTTRIRSESIKRKDPVTGKERNFPYGNVTDVRVAKSKIDAKQGHSTSIFIRYGYGIDDFFSIIEVGVTQKVIKREGAFYTLGNQRFQGKDKFRKFLMENPNVYEALRTKLVQAVNATAVDVPDELEDGDELLEGFDPDDVGDIPETVEEVVSESGGETEPGGA